MTLPSSVADVLGDTPLPVPTAKNTRPASGRSSTWVRENSACKIGLSGSRLEEVIHENLDIGRPDRRVRPQNPAAWSSPTPGRFQTRVFTEGVVPSLHVEYKTPGYP